MKEAFFDPARPMGRLQHVMIVLVLVLAMRAIEAVDTPEVGKVIANFGGLSSHVVTVAFIQLVSLASGVVYLFVLLRRASDLDWTWRSKTLVIALALFINMMRASLPNLNVDAFFDVSGPSFVLAVLVAVVVVALTLLMMMCSLTLLITPGKLWYEKRRLRQATSPTIAAPSTAAAA